MKLNTLKRTVATAAFGLVAILGTSEIANAQRNKPIQRQNQKVEKQQQKVQKQREKLQAQREKLERERQEQIRQQNIRNNRNVNSNNNRYRVYRNGSYYQTDNRGAELLRQAVNAGYQQGFSAGKNDRNGQRSGSYSNNSVYRSGNYGYQSYVDSKQYQYYFQQGFERGYQDGYNSRNQYGTNNNGSLNILGTILQGILNIQQF